MDKLAQIILKSPVNTMIAVIIGSLIPGLFIVSLIILGLVTLRKGAVAGLPVLALLSAVLISMYFYMLGYIVSAVMMALLLVAPIWILAIILRQTVSLEKTILAAVGITVVVSLSILAYGGWTTQGFYDAWLCQMGLNSQQFSSEQTQAALALLAQIAPLWPVCMFLQFISLILVARWWQARAFNPGGFQQEFHQLRFNKVTTSLAAAAIILSLTLGSATIYSLGLVAVALLSVHGLSVIHWYCAKKKFSGWILVPLYLVLFVVGWLLVPILIVLSLIDSFYSLRNRSLSVR